MRQTRKVVNSLFLQGGIPGKKVLLVNNQLVLKRQHEWNVRRGKAVG